MSSQLDEDEGFPSEFEDDFEKEMDAFWKDENPTLTQEDFLLEDDEDEDEYDYPEDAEIVGLDALEEEEIQRALAEEEEEQAKLAEEVALLQAEHEKETKEKLVLDRMNVEDLINMVSRVRLAWPENFPYYDAAEFATDPERAKFRESFFRCTDKEKMVLWHAENFRRQFQAQFPRRRAMVIAPKNECGCQKLFPTYIHPCVLGYPEFLSAETLIEFMKEFLAPEMMDHPTRFPSRIRSHYTVLKNRKANCYEYAIVLCCFLIGTGYDAYVVDGYASKGVCTMDATQDLLDLPDDPEDETLAILARQNDRRKDDGEIGTGTHFHSIVDDKSKETMGMSRFLVDLYGGEEEDDLEVRPVSPSKYRFKKQKRHLRKKLAEEEAEEEEDEDEAEEENDEDGEEEEDSSEQKDEEENESNEGSEEKVEGEEEDSKGSNEEEEEQENVEEEEPSKEEEEEEGYNEMEGEQEQDGDEEGNEGVPDSSHHIHWPDQDEMDREEFLRGVQGDGETETEESEEEMRKGRERPECPEKYYGTRTHAWVLVKASAGRRAVDESYFIEPFSGRILPLNDENFFGIEAVFNNKNFWVSHQDPQEVFVEQLDFDLDDNTKWSKLLVEPERKKKKVVDEKADGAANDLEDEEEEAPKSMELLLDMPVSWTPSPDIPQEDYDRKFPGGKKNFNYNNAIVEYSAPYVADDGLVRKIIKFKDTERGPEDLEYIDEKFENRKDKLCRRKWDRVGRVVHEYFLKGRKDALKEHVHISGRNNPSSPRDLYYWSDAHPQGLSHRKIIRKGIIEYFEGRPDRLYYRYTKYGSVYCSPAQAGAGGDSKTKVEGSSKARGFLEILEGKRKDRRKLEKIIEKYAPPEIRLIEDEKKNNNYPIAEKHFLLDEGKLRILFHYGPQNLTRQMVEFFKPVGDTEGFTAEDSIQYVPDPRAPPLDIYTLYKLLLRMEADQRTSTFQAAQAEEEVFSTVTSRVQEDFKHEIEPDAFAGEEFEAYMKQKEKEAAGTTMMMEEEEEEEDFSEADFASPFIEKFGLPRNKMEEVLMKKRIMLHAKVTLIKRAHYMKERYQREASHLKEKVRWYDNHLDKMTPEQEDEWFRMYRERLFEMHVMEKRLLRHKEEAPKKYYNFLVQVLKHPLLNKFSNKKIRPPTPPPPEMTESEKARLAALALKMKDCCQFYTVKYQEPKKEIIRKRKNTPDNHPTEEGVVPTETGLTLPLPAATGENPESTPPPPIPTQEEQRNSTN